MRRIALVCLAAVLFACQGDQSVTPPTGGPAALIQDARNSDFDHFFWLPPIFPQPAVTGAFNPDLGPSVEIRRLDLNGCLPGLVRTFSGTQIAVDLSSEQYHVNWDTEDPDIGSLDPACTYQIRVLVGTALLGFADVDVASSGRELRNIDNGQYIALLDGRTLPIKFRIESGALCGSLTDCGEGTARGGENTTIVTQNAQAGVFVPAGALPEGVEVTIIIESGDHSDENPCIPGVVGPTFEGNTGVTGNSCYQFRTDPLLSELEGLIEPGRFNADVTVGICVELSGVTESQEPYIQIFQFDEGEDPPVRALPNVLAPFLPCDESFVPPIGVGKGGFLNFAGRGLRSLLRPLASLISPRPLYASGTMVFDAGAGGTTDFFSTFTWGLVTNMAKNSADPQTAVVNTPVAVPPSVIFTDSTGAPVDSVPVAWTTGSGGGSVNPSSNLSGLNGIATVTSWTLGAAPGTYTLTASAPAGSGVVNSPQVFTATAIASDTIFKATFTADAVNAAPGPPETGTWSATNPAGTILVRAAVGDLTNKPVELDHNVTGAAGSLRLIGTVAGTPPATGSYTVYWRSLVHSADACFNGVVVRDAGALILASLEYRTDGQLTYNSTPTSQPPAGTWTQDLSQLFRIDVNLDAKTTSLSIDGTPVSTLQNVPFRESAAANLARISMELGCVVPPQQTYAWDDIMVVRVP